MEKYLGIVKLVVEGMNGVSYKLLTKSYDDPNLLKDWFSLYPYSERIILLNNKELESMFSSFKDLTPVSQMEKEHYEAAQDVYDGLFKNK
jgi:hypothetical protein